MRRWFGLGIVSLTVALLAAAPAQAADNVFEGWIDLGIWTIVVFLGLLFVLKKYAWKPMLEGLEKREQDIRAAVEESKKAREEAHALQQQLETERVKGAEQVAKMLDDARKAADELVLKMKAEASAAIQTDRERLLREVSTARDQALKEMWDQAGQLATLVAGKAIRRQLTIEDQRRLVDEALNEMKQAVRRNGQALHHD
jgi:F-type H+-transporting ATPase subunit b